MSRIFDALQRSEGEKTGDESSSLPKGPELLFQAERRATSGWKGALSVVESGSDSPEGGSRSHIPESLAGIAASVAIPVSTEVLTPNERTEIFNHFSTLQMSIVPESRLVSLLDRESPTAEAVRLLAVRLRDMRRTRMLKKIVITSSIPQEGKSTIASNLACSLARKNQEKVLLVGGDLRIPSVTKIFGIENKPGLCEVLRDERNLLESIYSVADTGIWVLPAGSAPSNPQELLQSQSLPRYMDQLSACFDWIIIDSPPVLPLADTSIWMRLADGVLLVTRQGVTEKKSLQKGLEALEPKKVLGALLNGSKASQYSYYYGPSGPS